MRPRPVIELDLQNALQQQPPGLPAEVEFQRWVAAALNESAVERDETQLTIRLVDEAEITELNATYRNKDSFDSFGAEIDLKSDIENGWELVLNYACLHIDYEDGERFRESPESKFNLGLNHLSEKFYGSLFARFSPFSGW